ncbi:hypothetical protein J3F84DRAFT_377336 [Trichoderma pleuroticola]
MRWSHKPSFVHVLSMLSPLCQGISKTRMWTPGSKECATNESDFMGVSILGLNFWKPGVLDFCVVVFVSLPSTRHLLSLVLGVSSFGSLLFVGFFFVSFFFLSWDPWSSWACREL